METDNTAIIQKIDYYYAHSLFDKLELFLQQRLKESGSSDYTTKIFLYNELGTLYRGLSRFEDAISCFQKTIGLLAETSGRSSLPYATALNNLGSTYRMAAKYDEARSCFREMTEIHSSYQEHDPVLYASGINNLALLDLAEGNYQKALPALRMALTIMSRDPNHIWEQATTICNIGICLLKTGQPNLAEAELLKADAILSAMPEERQGHLAAVRNALGQLYLDQGKYEKARAALSSAADLVLIHYGKNKDYTAIINLLQTL